MKLLLDTQVALWAITDSPKLGAVARELILSTRHTVYVSAASLWEIAIKHALGRGDMPIDAARAAHFFEQAGYESIAISPAHAVAVALLPSQAQHADPFDRLLIAQARVESMQLLSRDAAVIAYGASVLAV